MTQHKEQALPLIDNAAAEAARAADAAAYAAAWAAARDDLIWALEQS